MESVAQESRVGRGFGMARGGTHISLFRGVTLPGRVPHGGLVAVGHRESLPHSRILACISSSQKGQDRGVAHRAGWPAQLFR